MNSIFPSTRLGRIARIRSGDAISKSQMTDYGVPVFGANGKMGYVSVPNFPNGALCVGRVGSCGAINHHKYPVFISDNALVVAPSANSNPTFIEYVLRSTDFAPMVNQGAMPLLTGGDLAELRVSHPDLPTQAAIANYLDRKTAAIDALIEKKERLIEEVRKYQEAVIAEAVAPRQGWMEAFARRLIKEVKRGKAKSSDVLFEGECCSVPYLTPESIQNNSFFASSENKIPESMASYGRGDVAFCNIASVGKCGLITEDAGGNPQILGFSASSLVTPEFLLLLLRSRRKEFLLSATSSVVPYLPLEMILNTKFHVPEMEVQCEIYEFVNSKMLNSEKVIQVAEETLRNLKLLRSAMISEAVTGKLPLPAEIQ